MIEPYHTLFNLMPMICTINIRYLWLQPKLFLFFQKFENFLDSKMETGGGMETHCPPEPTEPAVNLTLEEAFLACSSRWYNTLRKYSFATEGVGLFSVAVVGILVTMQ